MRAILFSLFLAVISFQDLSAFSIGRDGDPYWENNVQWQRVKYDNGDTGFTASLPGEPKSGLVNMYAYSQSYHDGAYYEIHTSINERYKPPKKESDFVKQVKDAISSPADIVAIRCKMKNVKYVVEIRYKGTTDVSRIYCSSNQLYWALVEGKNAKLASQFFDSIKITR